MPRRHPNALRRTRPRKPRASGKRGAWLRLRLRTRAGLPLFSASPSPPPQDHPERPCQQVRGPTHPTRIRLSRFASRSLRAMLCDGHCRRVTVLPRRSTRPRRSPRLASADRRRRPRSGPFPHPRQPVLEALRRRRRQETQLRRDPRLKLSESRSPRRRHKKGKKALLLLRAVKGACHGLTE